MSSLKKRSATAFAWDIAGTILRQGSGFIISIFLARLLDPAEFGLIGMAMVFITVSQVFIDVGFASALIQNKDNTKLTYSSVFYLNLVAGIILTLIFYFSAPFIGDFYENQKITSLVRWLSLIFVFNSLDIVQIAILRRNLNFKVITTRGVLASTIGGVLGVTAAFMGFGVYSLVIQQISVALIGTALLWSISEWKPDFKFSFKEVKKLTGFSTFVFFDMFATSIFQRLDILLIGKVFSASILGFYTRAVSLKDQVTQYSSSSLTKVFYPVLSSLQDNNKEYNRVYFKVISVIAFVSYGFTGILYVLGQDVIIVLFGEKWRPAIQIFQILILSACNRPLNSMMVNAFMSKGKSKENFVIGIFRKGALLIPLYIAYFYDMYEFTVAYVIVSYFTTIVQVFLLKKYVGLPIGSHFKKIFEGMVPLLLIIGIYHWFGNENLLLRLLTAFIFCVSYLLYNWSFKSQGLMFIWSNAGKALKKLRAKM